MFQNYELMLKTFEKEELSNLQNQAENLLKECEKEDGDRLKELVQGKCTSRLLYETEIIKRKITT